jgi:hypothetical protein
MKTHGQSFLLLLICIAFPSFIILIGDKAVGEAPQSKDDIKTPAKLDANTQPGNRLFESFRMAEELVKRLGSGNLKNRVDAQRVADDSLRTILPDLLAEDKEHAQQLGFEKNSPRQDIALLPNVFPIFEVGLNQLRGFAPNTNSKTLLTYANQLLLPIGRNKQVQSSVTVRFIPSGSNGVDQQTKNDGWRPARWGRPHLIRRLTEEQAHLKAQGFLVSIPSLNRNFLGYEDDSVVKLIPLANDYLFEAGESYLAHDVFKQLAQEAESMDGSPR